jgi:ceramide glucosyltransferase
LQSLGIALALAEVAYLVLALWQTARYHLVPRARTAARPPATLMAPVKGQPPRLYECLRSFCRQDYPGLQIVCGLHSPDDPGRAVIERLQAEFPAVDLALVIDEARTAHNPKICNLTNMYPAVKHDLVVMLDSDVHADPHFLEVLLEPFADPTVGGVSCLYQGDPEAGLASRLGALYINDWFIPSALVDLSRREMDLTYGAAKAVRRDVLERIGGFAALANAVAEDDVFGELIHRAGFRLVLAPRICATIVAEPGLGALWHHELRWMRSVRACRPRDHLLSVVTHALWPVAALTALAPSVLGVALLAAILALRLTLHDVVQGLLPTRARCSAVWVPLREGLNFLIWLGSFAANHMDWNGQRLHATGGRRMVAADSTAAAVDADLAAAPILAAAVAAAVAPRGT